MTNGIAGIASRFGRDLGEGLIASTTLTPLPLVRQELGEARLGLQTSRDQARIDSLIQGAIQLKQIRDPQQKLAFLEQRRQELQRAGIGTEDTDEAIQLARAGNFDELERITDQAISLGQEKAPGFTLKPGDTRFTGTGEAIATVPGVAKDPSGVFVDLINPDGTKSTHRRDDPVVDDLIAQGATIAPAQKDPSVLVSLISPDGKTRVTKRRDDSEVDDLIAQGFTVAPEQRQDVSFEAERPERPPTTVDQSNTLWAQAGLSTGPVSTIASVLSVPSAIVGGPVATKTIEARQNAELEVRRLIRALSLSKKFPAIEQERIRKEVSIEPKFFDDEKVLRPRMVAIDKSLRRRLVQESFDAKDPSLPIATRNDARTSEAALLNFLEVLGVPQGSDELTPEERAELAARAERREREQNRGSQ